MTNGKKDEMTDGKRAEMADAAVREKLAGNGSLRRIMAWLMLVLFALLIVNISFFHVMIGESAILYVALVAVFFLGNGMRGGARQHDGQEWRESGESGESGEHGESAECEESGEHGEIKGTGIREKQVHGHQHGDRKDIGKNRS